MFTALKEPAAAVLTVADERVGLPDASGRVWWCEGREEKVTLFFVLGVGFSD